MSDINNLISRILNDAEEESKKIIAEAEGKAADILAKSGEEAKKEQERIIEAAKDEAEKAAEQLIMGKKLEIRNEHLDAKRSVIDKTFETVVERLNNMPKNEFWEFLLKQLLAADLDGEELVLPSKYGVTDITELNARLAEKGSKGNLTLHNGQRDVDGGFLLLRKGIENNNTFKALVDYYRYELESEITAKLF